MKKLVLLIDLDNVIADQRQGFYNILECQYPHIERPPLEELNEFDIELSFPQEHRDLIKAIRLRKNFFRDLPIIDGAYEGLNRLLALGHEVRIVTAPTWEWKNCIHEKYEWVENHLGREWVGRMIFTRDKTLIQGDVLIDDAPTVEGISTPTWKHIPFEQPYNVQDTLKKDTVNWNTLEAVLEELFN